MKTKCTHPGCGAVIETGNDQALADKLLKKHFASEHVTVEAKQKSALTKCLAVFKTLESEGLLTDEFREAMNEVCDLLQVPRAPEGVKENDT
jgi:hypothetical protein